MIDLDNNFSALPLYGFRQFPERRNLPIGVNEGHTGKRFSLLQDSGMFKSDIAGPPLGAPNIIGDMPLVDRTIRARKIRGHGGHNDAVVQL